MAWLEGHGAVGEGGDLGLKSCIRSGRGAGRGVGAPVSGDRNVLDGGLWSKQPVGVSLDLSKQSDTGTGAGHRLITTYLEMNSRADVKRSNRPAAGQLQLMETNDRSGAVNRFFYGAVGGMWTWHDKAGWGDSEWQVYAADESLRTWVATVEGREAGYFELRRDGEGGVEIAYFGLLPEFIGRGLGGELLTRCLETAWGMDPVRVWVHTCSLDHPSALLNYQARGMKIYKVEEAPVAGGS